MNLDEIIKDIFGDVKVLFYDKDKNHYFELSEDVEVIVNDNGYPSKLIFKKGKRYYIRCDYDE